MESGLGSFLPHIHCSLIFCVIEIIVTTVVSPGGISNDSAYANAQLPFEWKLCQRMAVQSLLSVGLTFFQKVLCIL